MNDNNDTTTYYWYCFLFFFNEQNHHLTLKYDFHSYMIRSMEEEFQRIVGVRWDTSSRRNIVWYIHLAL